MVYMYQKYTINFMSLLSDTSPLETSSSLKNLMHSVGQQAKNVAMPPVPLKIKPYSMRQNF
jgi:CMP-N-acetylneuraminic acid synthetase